MCLRYKDSGEVKLEYKQQGHVISFTLSEIQQHGPICMTSHFNRKWSCLYSVIDRRTVSPVTRGGFPLKGMKMNLQGPSLARGPFRGSGRRPKWIFTFLPEFLVVILYYFS